ncbi:unnamed protein product [Nippostrongylus brasiliensis]|uniref:Pan3_PK domain-containing protein n=1 Tax=Nippostrongylus brasiliensis TaxID=27835 RepID=A0A0N4YVU0_NIPBR|nr:unnamed protein product [Nippostrongylus brasiliensis]
MPMIGARFYSQLETAQMRNDMLENELSKELENGRLFRILAKINTIVERPEHNLDPSWSETGDRFLIKLFRDYVFHQVTESGKPWMDMAHIVQCLNKVPRGGFQRVEHDSLCGSSSLVVSTVFLSIIVRKCSFSGATNEDSICSQPRLSAINYH